MDSDMTLLDWMMQDTNVLIFDEPTNHIHMEAIEALNNALKVHEVNLVFVSHVREFASTLVNRILEIKDQKMHVYEGTYDEFQASKGLV